MLGGEGMAPSSYPDSVTDNQKYHVKELFLRYFCLNFVQMIVLPGTTLSLEPSLDLNT